MIPIDRRIPALVALVLFVVLLAVLGPVTPAGSQPTWWATLGAELGSDQGGLSKIRGKEAGALLGGGMYVLRPSPLLVGIEVQGEASRVKENLGTEDDSIDTWRARLGVRVTWWEEHDEPLIVPYLFGGAVYRADRQTRRDDDGVGWYAGIGLDLRLSDHWAIGPTVRYEDVALRSRTKALLLSIGLTFSY